MTEQENEVRALKLVARRTSGNNQSDVDHSQLKSMIVIMELSRGSLDQQRQ